MGRRARTRAAGADGASSDDARRSRGDTKSVPETPARRARTGSALTPERRLVAAFLGGAALLGLITLIGIGTLGGATGPFIVLAVAVLLAFGLLRFGARRLADADLSEEDKLMRLLAALVALMAVVLAAINVVVSLVVA